MVKLLMPTAWRQNRVPELTSPAPHAPDAHKANVSEPPSGPLNLSRAPKKKEVRAMGGERKAKPHPLGRHSIRAKATRKPRRSRPFSC